MGDTTLSTVTLDGTYKNGKARIRENTDTKKSDLVAEPMYGFDSADTPVFDWGGVTKTITLSGTYIGDSQADCKIFVDDLEALIAGAQDVALTLTDDFRGTIRVKIQDSKTTHSAGAPTEVTWTLTLIEASLDG